jgi:hypothetical protein
MTKLNIQVRQTHRYHSNRRPFWKFLRLLTLNLFINYIEAYLNILYAVANVLKGD